MDNRRDFIKKIAAGTAGLSIGGSAFGFSAKSYRNIIGANDSIRVAMIGVNSRGNSMSAPLPNKKTGDCHCICDVDERAIPKALKRFFCRTTEPPNRKRIAAKCWKINRLMPFTLRRPTTGMLRLPSWVVRPGSMFMLKNR